MLLTKSKYLSGLQCLKRLWYEQYAKSEIPPHDEATQFRFDQGHLVNDYSRRLFPDGIQLSEDDFKGNISKTQELLSQGKVLFEPGFMYKELYARADILVPSSDEWDIIEVKSSTEVKDINVQDVAFQRYVYTRCGLKIGKCYVMFINNQYVKDGEIDPSGLFVKEDVTLLVDEIDVEENISKMSLLDKPSVPIGPHCNDPYSCNLIPMCWDYLPEHSFYEVYNSRKKWSFFDNGWLGITDIPDSDLDDKQLIQKNAVLSGDVHVDKDKIKEFLAGLEYPLYYLDFESVNPVIPLWDGTRPYQQIPFQFSLHIQQEDGSIEHHEFLSDTPDDPRPAFLAKLKEVIGTTGSIIVYNQSFEKRILRELCQEDNWYEETISRFVDLLAPFRSFHYYNPSQSGSASIKQVLPAVVGKSYSDLDISDGNAAGRAWLSMIYSDINDQERAKLRKDLLKYCGLDTEGMVWIVDILKNMC